MKSYFSTLKSLFFCIVTITCSLNFNNIVLAEKFWLTGYRRLLPSTSSRSSQSSINVLDYGAVGDGLTDDSEAFLKAWEQVCIGSNEAPLFQVPAGKTFLLKPIKFQGPCKSSSISVQIEGKLEAAKTVEGWRDSKRVHSWIKFAEIQGLRVNGSGQLDAHGSLWWNNPILKKKGNRPAALLFHQCKDIRVQGLTHLNSPMNHISINQCQNVDLLNLRIIAPQDSPNTDGIDISSSTNVHVHHSQIETGDDCIAINDGSSFISIDNVLCGPGHGISVGSLGKDGAYQTVEAVFVKNCTFNGSRNGARIKTWEGGSGFARNITFEDIKFKKTGNPIIIDQHYRDGGHKPVSCDKKQASAVQVSNVIYRNMHGTSATTKAITLLCSKEAPCLNLVFHNVHINASIPGQVGKAYAENAQVKVLFSTSPTLVFKNYTSD